MRNTGILLFLAGIYIVINSGSLRDVVFGKAKISFLNPKSDKISPTTGGVVDEEGNPQQYGPPTTPNPEVSYA